jgi:alpha-L-arabinofuranosidase
VIACSKAIKEVQPDALIGVGLHTTTQGWGNYVLKQAAGHYDFVVGHYYASGKEKSFEEASLGVNYRMLDHILSVNALIGVYNPDRPVRQLDTEWGITDLAVDGQPPSRWRGNNIWAAMHRAVRLIHYLREAPLRGASSWEMFSHRRAPGFGFLAQNAPQLRSMTYWLYYHFNRHAGRWVLPIDGTAPYYEGSADGRTYRGPLTPAVATLSDDENQLFVILASGSWTRTVPCRMEFRGFLPQQATGVVLSHSDPDGDPFLERKEDLVGELPMEMNGSQLTTQLPPHAAVFITLQR